MAKKSHNRKKPSIRIFTFFVLLLLLTSLFILANTPQFKSIFTGAATVSVSTASELQSRINNASAGDIILVNDTTMNSSINISNKNGTSSNPIIIRAKNTGNAIFSGGVQFTITNSSHISVEGFKFRGKKYSAVLIDSSNNIRISKNYFHVVESSTSSESVWLFVRGTSKDILINRNEFVGKRAPGRFISVWGNGSTMSQNVTIERNYFKDVAPRIENGKEAIQLGLAEYTRAPSYSTVQYNIFEGCNGDPEIVSVKSSNNTIQYNTFLNNKGMLVLRHGNKSTVRGNVFLGNGEGSIGGVRIYGSDHVIQGNYFERMTSAESYGAIVLPKGNESPNSGNVKGYLQAVNTTIENNIAINNDYGIVVGNGSHLPPLDTKVRNNIVIGTKNPLYRIYTPTTLENNIAYTTGSATVGVSSSGVRVTNPGLTPLSVDGGSSIRTKLPNIRKLSTSDVGPKSGGESTPVPTNEPTNAPAPTVTASQGLTIDVYAAGNASGTTRSGMQILVNGTVVKSYDSIGGDMSNRVFQKYTYTGSQTSFSEIRVRVVDKGIDSLDLLVDKIVVNGKTYESENSYISGYWNGSSCSAGYLSKERIHCSGGYIRYSVSQ